MAANAQLGSFSYDMLLNIAKFEEGLTKAQRLAEQRASAIQKSIRGAADSITEGFKDMAGKVIAAFAVERLVEFGKQALEMADQVGKAAEKVGLSTQAISALGAQAKLSNVDVGAFQSGLEKLARNATEAAAGSKQQAAAFNAMGVSVKDASGNMRPMQAILEDVTRKFAGYEAGATKTALAQALFGKSGAELIPMLNEIGQEGLPEVIKQMQQYGVVVTPQASQAAEHFNDNLTKLGLEAQGFASQLSQQLLPYLNKLTDDMVKAGQTTDNYSSAVSVLSGGIKILIAALITVKEMFSSLVQVVTAFVDATVTSLKSLGQFISVWATSTGKAFRQAFTLDFAGMKQTQADARAQVAQIGKEWVSGYKEIGSSLATGLGDAIRSSVTAWSALSAGVQKTSNAFDGAHAAIERVQKQAPLIPNTAAVSEAENAMTRLNEALTKDAEVLAGLAGKVDPVQAKYQEYVKAIISANKAYQDELALAEKAHAGDDKLAQAKANLTAKTLAAQKALQAEGAELVKQNDVVGKLFEKLQEESAALTGMNDREREQAQAVAEATRAWNDLNPAIQAYLIAQGKIDPTTKAGSDAIRAQVGVLYDQKKAVELAGEAAKQWQSIWITAGDGIASTFSKILVEGGSLFDGLKSLARQTVEAIIQYFAKLAVINPILNSIFGGQAGFSLLPMLSSALGGGGGVGGALSGAGGAGAAGGGTSMFSGLFSAGQTMFSGFSNAASNLWGGSATNPASANFMGPPVEGQVVGPQYGGYSSGFGQALGGAAALYAGYNRFQQGGALGGVAGGATYAAGTYALGAGISSAIAGTGFAAGVSGAFAAIPVVGWIALAAMLIDKISGGKLFGTSANKFQGGTQTETISASGADVSAVGTFKGQRALFGGAYYKTKDIPVSDEAKKAADDFFAQLQQGTQEFAKSFGVDLTDIVGGSFATTFDKKGNVTGTSTTVLGVTRKDETAQQFAERLQADNFLAVLDKMGLGASEFVKGFQDDADALFKAVQDFAQATTAAKQNLEAGFKFMALSSDQSLADVVKFAEGLTQSGETLSAAYSRLAQAQQQYYQFVSQFAPMATYVDPFEASLAQLQAQMTSDIATANALAKASGATGIELQDLSNIQQRYAGQMAQLVQQLEANAQQLAFSLGLTLFGSLDQINAEIDRLSGQTDSASSSVTDFGTAIQQTGQKANAALNLLLGNLSPLNDQQKLQAALNGLRSGQVDPETVLEIGRRLYASTEAYNVLFNEVKGYAGRATGSTGGRSGGSSTSTSHILSAEDQKRLADLMKERDQLQAAATLQQYQNLAQQISEIAMAKGETYQQIIKEMGIDQAALEKALGIKSDADFDAYMANIQKQTDSAGNNTKSIVDAINQMRIEFVLAVGGKPSGVPNQVNNPNSLLPSLSPSGTTDGGKIGNPGTVGIPNKGTAQPGAGLFTKADADTMARSFFDALVRSGYSLERRGMRMVN